MPKKPNYAAQFDEQPVDEAEDFKRVFGGVKVPKGLQPGSTELTALEWVHKSPTSLTIDTELNEDEWFALLGSIETIHKRYQWYLGDAMVYGIRREYGATDEQMKRLEELTGKAKTTLYDYQRTALRFENSERSENVDFEQHRVIVNAFPDDTPEHRAERLRWLHIAETEGMSGRKLNAEIAAAKLPASVADEPPLPDERPALSDEDEEEATPLFDDFDLTDPVHEKRFIGFRKRAAQNRYAEIDLIEIQEAEKWLAVLRKKVAQAKVEADKQARMKTK